MKLFEPKNIGDCFYTYDERTINSKIETLRKCFPGFELNYSIKTNPNEDIMKFLLKCGLGVDAASKAEVLKAVSLGYSKSEIWYSAPGKDQDDIESTFNKCTIVADSINELSIINNFSTSRNVKSHIGVRINPALPCENSEIGEIMCGRSSQFGIDEELFIEQLDEIKLLSNIEISGIHIYVGSQILNHKTICEIFSKTFQIAEKLINEYNVKLEFINFGGGFGVPYAIGDSSLDFVQLQQSISKLVHEYQDRIGSNVKYLIESGRFIVTEAGKFYCRIADVKESRKTKYIIVRGGVNAFFRPAFKKISYIASTSSISEEFEIYTIVGNTCTPEDIFATDVVLRKSCQDDYICIYNAGSYGYSMSLLEFIGLGKPKEVYLDKDGNIL